MNKLATAVIASLAFGCHNFSDANAAEATIVSPTTNAPLFDGHCDQDEWKSATRIDLPADTAIYLMHDSHSLYVCAKGKPEDYTVIDLYIEDASSGQLYNLHASAQLSESVLTGDEWQHPVRWNNKNWGGFWVPYAGNEETEKGPRTKFLKGSHREIQVLRKKFGGGAWNMMMSIGAVYQDGEYGAELSYPDKGISTDKTSWTRLTFSE